MSKKKSGKAKKKGASTIGTLNPMQSAFVAHYVIEKSATEAARKAGYSEKTAGQIGYENLKKPEIREAISERFRQQNDRLDLRADRVLLEILRLGTSDIAQAYDEKGNLKPIHEIPEDVRRCIESIETEQVLGGEGDDATMITVKRVKWATKKPALELLAKHFKLLTEKIEHSGKIGLEALIAGSSDAGSEED